MPLYGGLSRFFENFTSPYMSQGEGYFSPERQRRVAQRNLFGDAGAPTSLATAGNVTLTIAQLKTGVIVRDPAGGNRTDTLPTAALAVAGLSGIAIGDKIVCDIANGADAAETITIAAGTGGAFDTNQTAASQVIPQNQGRRLILRFTGVAAGSEAYVAYLI